MEFEKGGRYSRVIVDPSIVPNHTQWKRDNTGDWLWDPDCTVVSEAELCEALKKVGELQEGLKEASKEVVKLIKETVELEAANRDLKADVNRFKGYILDPGNPTPLRAVVEAALTGAEFGAGVDIDKQVRDGDSAKEPVKPITTDIDPEGQGRRKRKGYMSDREGFIFSERNKHRTGSDRRKSVEVFTRAWNQWGRRKEDFLINRKPPIERRKEARRDSGQVGRRTIGSSRRTGEERRKT